MVEIPRCPRCHERVIKKSLDGKIRIRTTIVAFSKGRAEIVCRKCGAEIEVDLRLGPELRKALADPGPKLVVRK